ncbi:Son of sevenless-like protein 2 [Armadillidium nasatum]|uniref:Son of sevenless-like protein 2 n=1 Tax=Armadillidium nasatum TaxID=96803 RepID=A0A5N5SRW4_9CRUS|nr:Son of sevenless-like protein 2 [Armadillidium nasatum]
MFPSNNSDSEFVLYDFESEENSPKWKKLFTDSLQKVLSQVHPKMTAKEDALDYVESLILRLLAMLCALPSPHTVQDVEDRVLRTFPNPIDQWAIGDAQAAIEKGRKKTNLVLPVDRVHSQLRDTLQMKLDYQVTLYIVAILEYISADILKVLMDMFHQDDGNDDPLLGPLVEEPSSFVDGSLTYEDLVKDLIIEEKAYIRELHMIKKVFMDKLYEIPALQGPDEKRELDFIFSNINEIYEFSVNLLGSLEDTLEVTKEEELPDIGTCFEELAEGAEFDVYAKYGGDVLRIECREALLALIDQPDVGLALTIVRHGFKEAVKYYLPRLLLVPVVHVFSYFKYIELLLNVADNEETKESLEQVKGLLWPLQSQLDRAIQASPYNSYLKRKLGELSSRHGRSSRQAMLQKLNEIQKSIEGWEGKDIAQCCSEYIMEGSLKFGPVGKKQTDRYVFLFDGLIVLCKCKMNEYKFKEKFLMRMVEIIDRSDSDELRHSFEIRPREQPSIVLTAKTSEDKSNWMAALVRINTQSMLERVLDSILLHEETKHPLRLPEPSIYPFSVEDSEDNIIIEEKENSGTPVIRGAALFKLVERLTYHMYADPMFVRTFLTTYRSFCSPMELLDLLIQRFDIPEPKPPDISEDDPSDIKAQKIVAMRESLKRFRKEYSQPVQFRVLNVLRHWVDYHFYDFESDQPLLEKLTSFLDGVKGKSMKKWVDSITKIILRKCNEEPREITFSHNKSPPSPKVHLHMEDRDWELALPLELGNTIGEPDVIRPLLMLHPIEIARQLTLLDFDLYRAVKPSELVGVHWTKEDKETRSPNLMKMIHHTNGVTNWLQRCVVDCDNFEERVAVFYRIIEILVMLYDLNNFSGVFQVCCALDSASVHRLEATKSEVKRRLHPYTMKIYEETLELNKNHYKRYLEKLRSINPPCVPFFGMYLTNILHIEEGNPDFLPRGAKGLVNFNKRRKVADITGEIQQYQNQPYCLENDAKIRNKEKVLKAGFWDLKNM